MRVLDFFRITRFRRYSGVTLDLVTAACAFLLSYVTIYGSSFYLTVPGLEEKTLSFVVIFACFHWLLSVYRGSWRYVSIPDLITILKVSVASVVAYTVFAFISTRGTNIPRSVPVLTLLNLIAGLSTSRLLYRLVMERAFFPSGNQEKRSGRRSRTVLLYGLSDNADSFIRANRRGAKSDFNVLGILDDGILNQARIVQGVKVLGNLHSLPSIANRLESKGVIVSELIVTESAASRQHLAEIVELAASLGIKVSRIPDFTETAAVTGRTMLQPKAIDLGDLLGRPEIVTDLDGVARLINNKVIMVTGAGGSIGSELCRQIADFGPSRLILADSSEFLLYTLDLEIREAHPSLNVMARLVNVCDRARVLSLFMDQKPDSVFHAAALKHVPLVEENAVEGIKTNVLGTRNVADAALKCGATNFVMISTDKAVNPTNVMGATKRAAEAYCQSKDVTARETFFKTVRFGNVLGSNGSVVPRFQEQIANGGPVTVTHPDIVRFFMTIPEAVRLVLNASAKEKAEVSERGKIMVLDMGKPVKIVDLAERMIQLAGFKPYAEIDIKFTGLRPGEKLYEELFDPSEAHEQEENSSYFVAAPRLVDDAILQDTLTELEGAVEKEDRQHCVALLARIVPEYTPNGSSSIAPQLSQGDSI